MVKSRLSPEEFLERLHHLEMDEQDPETVLSVEQVPLIDKYDFMVLDNLLRSAFLHNRMDLPGAVQLLQTMQ